MIVKVEADKLVQKCVCGGLCSVYYEDLQITGKFIQLPLCSVCGSLEVLHNNDSDDDHSIKVMKIFAKVATQG